MSDNIIKWEDFERVDLRIGTIVRAEPFPEAKKPAFKLWVDLGPLGVKQSSAQLTVRYSPANLIGTQVLAVTNLPPRQVGPFVSEILVTGFVGEAGDVVLARPEFAVPNGSKLA
jgi:tRNA-binding protein